MTTNWDGRLCRTFINILKFLNNHLLALVDKLNKPAKSRWDRQVVSALFALFFEIFKTIRYKRHTEVHKRGAVIMQKFLERFYASRIIAGNQVVPDLWMRIEELGKYRCHRCRTVAVKTFKYSPADLYGFHLDTIVINNSGHYRETASYLYRYNNTARKWFFTQSQKKYYEVYIRCRKKHKNENTQLQWVVNNHFWHF